jgi:sulfatase maturation enzyme AslB (radical SAM superfamily)
MIRDEFYAPGPEQAYGILDEAGLPRSFCVLPWTHAMAKHTGRIKPCCLWPDSPTRDGFPLLVPGRLDIDSVMNGPEYAALRASFLRGDRLEACGACHRAEDAGMHSYRTSRIVMYGADQLRDIAATGVDGPIDDLRLHWFDFRMSNICNLKCRMCFPTGSSRIEQEYVELGWDFPPRMDDETARQWFEEFAAHIGHARNIYFAGGEPLMMETHWKILDRLAEAGNTDLALSYSTNLTQVTYRKRSIFDMWNRFSDVYVTLSVDHVGSGAEYIRHGTVWEEWLRNFDMLRERCPHVKYKVATTVTALNAIDLPRIAEELLRIGAIHDGNSMEMFPAEHPEYLNVQSMPPSLKDACESAISAWCDAPPAGLPSSAVPGMLGVVSWMRARDTFDGHGREMLRYMSILDGLRGEDIWSCFPDLCVAYKEAMDG